MKKLILSGVLSLGVLLLTGCDEKWNAGGSGQGRFTPVVTLDDNAVNSCADGDEHISRAATITANDLKLTLTHHNGKKYTWNSIADMNPEQEFPIGTYTLEATYGNKNEEGFEKPHFYGISNRFTIRENETSNVSVTASHGNALVSIACSDEFKGYFVGYEISITSKNSQNFVYTDHAGKKDESRPFYVAPGAVSVKIKAVKQTGAEVNYNLTSFTAEAAHHYRLNITVNDGNVGSPKLVISFDDTMEKEDVWIDLSKDLTNTPAPVITPLGFENGGQVTTIAGNSANGQLEMNIIAEGGFASVILETKNSPSLEKIGWPMSIDLMAASDEDKQTLKSLGFREMGLWTNPGTMAVIDLADVCANLRYLTSPHNNISEFSLKVVDHLSDGTNHMDSIAFDVKVVQREVNLDNPSEMFVDQTNLTFELKSNGPKVSDLIFQYENAQFTWTTIDSSNISRERISTENGYVYRYNIKGLPEDVDFKLQVVTEDTEETILGTQLLDIKRAERPFAISVDERNIFARRGMLTVLNDGNPDAELASKAVLYLSDDGGKTYTRKAPASIDGANLRLTGLSSNQTYMARIVVDGGRSRNISFTTEKAAQIPNGNMNNWCNDGGNDNWTVYYPFGVNDKDADRVWSTYNPVTTSLGGNATWLRPQYNYAYSTTSGTQPTDDSHGTGEDNNKAAMIRTVGWGYNSASASSSNSGLWHFSKCDNVSAGQLFLGNWDGVNPVQNAEPNYGWSCSSRPYSMTFYYKYAQMSRSGNDNGQKGVAIIKIIDANNKVISEQTLLLEQNCKYANIDKPSDGSVDGTYEAKTISLTYPELAEKAAKIQVIFKSSQLTNGQLEGLKNESNMRPPASFNLNSDLYLGSTLFIDDITLNY